MRALAAFAVLAAVAVVAGPSVSAQDSQYDVLIRDGRVIDGTGDSAVSADVAIRGDTIAAVGDLSGATADRVIDASGLVVAPGFIDVHSHAATALAERGKRHNEGFLRQGVTTIVGGPDGYFGPWRIRELIETYRKQGVGTNVAFYVGHNGIRDSVVGNDSTVTPSEMERMKEFVRRGMEMGAVGFSTGLMYPPGMYSTTDEVVELTSAVRPFGGIYDSHIRNPVHDLLGSVREVIEIAERAGVPGKIAHLKAVGLKNAGQIRDVIELVEDARARGLEIVSDQYPYDGAGTGSLQDIIVAPDSLTEQFDDVEAALRDPAARRVLRRTSEQGIEGGFAWIKTVGYGSMRVVHSPSSPGLEGRYLSRLAEERGIEPFELVAELILRNESPVRITTGAVREEDVRALLEEPWNMIASDGRWTDGSDDPDGHPRSAGTFPRLLGHYVREEGVLSLAEAVRKITSFPARFLGLSDRGVLAEERAADVVVFDPDRIIGRSSWEHPQRYAEGVVHVLVNGVPVLQEGDLTGKTPGRYVRRQPNQ